MVHVVTCSVTTEPPQNTVCERGGGIGSFSLNKVNVFGSYLYLISFVGLL